MALMVQLLSITSTLAFDLFQEQQRRKDICTFSAMVEGEFCSEE